MKILLRLTCGPISGVLVLACTLTAATPVRAAETSSTSGVGTPKFDLYDRFDERESPLQGAVLAARDKKWRKNLKLGPDPRCGRVIRDYSRNREPKLCAQEGLAGDACLAFFCCEDPQAVTCPAVSCAGALINGEDDDIRAACYEPEFLESLPPDEPTCAEAVFGRGGGSKVDDCLENPDADGDGEIDPRCRKIWEKCDDLPLLTQGEPRAHDIKGNGAQSRGRRIETATIIHYKEPKQRGNADAPVPKQGWDGIELRSHGKNAEKKQRPPAAGENVNRPGDRGNRVRGQGVLIPDCEAAGNCSGTLSLNDDGDCVDELTGERRRGADCDAPTLESLGLCPVGADMVFCCRHLESFEVLYGDDCLDEDGQLRSTLQPAFDEDPPDLLNNDGDCLSLAGGLLTSDCLDSDGTLRDGYEWAIDEEGECGDDSNLDQDCMGTDGRIGRILGDRCVDEAFGSEIADWTPLLDEDCFDALDNDGDGLLDEDPPEVGVDDEELACRAQFRQMGLEPDPEELPDRNRGCDLTRAMRVHVNREADQNQDFKQDHRVNGRKFFNVDDHGRWLCQNEDDPCPDAGVINPKGANKFEERKVNVNEVFAVKCKPVRDRSTHEWIDTRYDEERGVCVPEAPPSPAKRVVLREDREAVAAADCEGAGCARAMMGFTFAPPVLEWGVRIREEVCFFGFCFEIFYARIGYEFDLAAGLRLPVEVQFEGIPGMTSDWLDGIDNDGDGLVDEVLAEEEFELATTLEPLDFTVGDYRAFCEQHHLDEPWYISDCERFAFPDFLDSLLPFENPDDRDGDEFVAHYSIFAGIVVRLFYIPLINWGIDSSVDVPAVCTMFKIKDQVTGVSLKDLLELGMGIVDDGAILETIKENLANCGSFPTPFGVDPDSGELRGFPFLSGSFSIRADCFDAMRNGEFITVGGKKRPLCTGLILGTNGASLGVGLGLESTAGSRLIQADLETAEDAVQAPGAVTRVRYRHSSADPAGEQLVFGPVLPGNYEPEAFRDHARVRLDDFTYYLNALQIKLSANLEFGGILSPIPDIGSFTLYNFIFDTEELFGFDGIPIPQHAYTEPVEIPLLVENYGLEVHVRPDPEDPAQQIDPKTLLATPGEPAAFQVAVRNMGSVPGDFDDFAVEISNHPDQASMLTFFLDPNTDHDCYVGDVWHRGDPFDGIADDCYDAGGALQPGAVVDARVIDEDPVGCLHPGPCASVAERDDDGDGIADEDPVDVWAALPTGFPGSAIEDVAAHSECDPAHALGLTVTPFRHPMTRPGIYAFRVTADSREARQLGLGGMDESGNYRMQSTELRGMPEDYVGAEEQPHIAFLEVQSFFDPQIALLPGVASSAPGQSRTYVLEGTNGANVDDAMAVVKEHLDFNPGGCDLPDLGTRPDSCPLRAVPTAVPADWLVGAPPARIPVPGDDEFLPPLGSRVSDFGLSIPPDWAGMEDATYRIKLTASSLLDPETPTASNVVVLEHTVQATLESQTRYVGLEIDALIAVIEAAGAAGIATKGLHPIATHPVRLTNHRALDRVLAGDARGALGAHAANVHTTDAFVRALQGSGKGLPEDLFLDWKRRADAILADLHAILEAGGVAGAVVVPEPVGGIQDAPVLPAIPMDPTSSAGTVRFLPAPDGGPASRTGLRGEPVALTVPPPSPEPSAMAAPSPEIAPGGALPTPSVPEMHPARESIRVPEEPEAPAESSAGVRTVLEVPAQPDGGALREFPIAGWEGFETFDLVRRIRLDTDAAARLQMLPRIEEAFASGEISGKVLAAFTDRVLRDGGLPQRYGTQAEVREGEVRFYPIEGEERVDERRAALGLEPLAEYRRILLEAHAMGEEAR